MSDYISREDAKEAAALIALTSVDRKMTCGEVKQIVESIPAADVRPAVRGKWVQDCNYHFRCSVCGDRRIVSNGNPLDVANGWNFCPNCGADMRSELPKEET